MIHQQLIVDQSQPKYVDANDRVDEIFGSDPLTEELDAIEEMEDEQSEDVQY